MYSVHQINGGESLTINPDDLVDTIQKTTSTNPAIISRMIAPSSAFAAPLPLDAADVVVGTGAPVVPDAEVGAGATGAWHSARLPVTPAKAGGTQL